MIEGLHISPNGPASLQGSQESKMILREEPMLRESTRKVAGFHIPRRSNTTHDYKIPTPPMLDARTVLIHQTVQRLINVDAQVALQESSSIEPIQESHEPSPVDTTQATRAQRPRPPLGAPRRSYSVMDYEPVPPEERPCANMTLSDLPQELHFCIFDFLDPIDSTCLGLTSEHFYDIHRRMHGTIPLSVRRDGPNDMERVWYLSGRLITGSIFKAPGTANVVQDQVNHASAMLRVHGQAMCRKCGISRCELYKHILEWMPAGYEYCTVRDKFTPAAAEGAREYCYLSSPKDSHQCGRHRVRKAMPESQ